MPAILYTHALLSAHAPPPLSLRGLAIPDLEGRVRSGIRSCVGGLIAAKEGGKFERITIKVWVRLEERCHRFVCLGGFELTGPLILAVE